MSNAYGSIINRIVENNKLVVPQVGMGATKIGLGSDLYAYTVIKVLSPTRAVVQADITKRIDHNGMSEDQSYEYIPTPEGRTCEISLRKDGKWHEGRSMKGDVFVLGARRAYHDFSF